MVWVLSDGQKEWSEFYHEIEMNDLFSLVELNEHLIKSLELKMKSENDRCNHKTCNDRGEGAFI